MPSGEYIIEEYLILNEENQTIYAIPTEESNLNSLVSHPLPYTIKVEENKNNLFSPEVLPTFTTGGKSVSLEAFGYISFSLNIKDYPIPFQMVVLDASDKIRGFHLKIESRSRGIILEEDYDEKFQTIRIESSGKKEALTLTVFDKKGGDILEQYQMTEEQLRKKINENMFEVKEKANIHDIALNVEVYDSNNKLVPFYLQVSSADGIILKKTRYEAGDSVTIKNYRFLESQQEQEFTFTFSNQGYQDKIITYPQKEVSQMAEGGETIKITMDTMEVTLEFNNSQGVMNHQDFEVKLYPPKGGSSIEQASEKVSFQASGENKEVIFEIYYHNPNTNGEHAMPYYVPKVVRRKEDDLINNPIVKVEFKDSDKVDHIYVGKYEIKHEDGLRKLGNSNIQGIVGELRIDDTRIDHEDLKLLKNKLRFVTKECYLHIASTNLQGLENLQFVGGGFTLNFGRSIDRLTVYKTKLNTDALANLTYAGVHHEGYNIKFTGKNDRYYYPDIYGRGLLNWAKANPNSIFQIEEPGKKKYKRMTGKELEKELTSS